MPLLRRAPLVRVTVDLFPDREVAITLEPHRSRWPGHEGDDRFVAPLALAALSLHHAVETEIPAVRERLYEAATAISGGRDGDDAHALARAASGLNVVPSTRVGNPRIELLLERSSRGPVPSLAPSPADVTDVADAAGAAVPVCLDGRGPGVLLAAALALEGVLGWYGVDNPRRKLTEEAVAFGLRHAAARMAEGGHVVPSEVTAAIEERRRISTMPGEAGAGG